VRLGPDNSHRLDSVVLLLLFGLFLFFSPFTFWWATMSNAWYLPYLLWLGLIVMIAWVVRRYGHDI
jgi:hypothetical protein